MNNIFINSEDQSLIVFKIWKSLSYKVRVSIGLACILTGFGIQYSTLAILPGVVPIFAGNLLLLPRGYTRRCNLGVFNPSAEWEKVKKNKLDELLQFERKVKRWDRSLIDISNPLGFIFFLIPGIDTSNRLL